MKINWKKITVQQNTKIVDVLKRMDESEILISLVVDENESLVGTMTDGDMRRGLIKGINLDGPVSTVMNPNPTFLEKETSSQKVNRIMDEKKIKYIPIVDEQKRVIDLAVHSDYQDIGSFKNPVVLMAGGLGKRLRPLTENCPKPLLKVGSKPILQVILEHFKSKGFRNFYFSVNYKGQLIEDYFADGKEWGVSIEYLREEQPMGTAGALSLLPREIDSPFIVMNGDLLTNVDFSKVLEFHIDSGSEATMCVRDYNFQVPYGVLSIEQGKIKKVVEKPIQSFFVNAGIYTFNPSVLDLIPKNKFFDVTDLIGKMREKNMDISGFPIREYWLDIGRMEDYKKASIEIEDIFNS